MSNEIIQKPSAAMAPAAPESNIEILLRAAVESKLDVASIKELVALKNAEEDRLAKRAFSVSMAAFRGDMPAIRKSMPGQHGVTHAGTKTRGMFAPIDTITPILDPVASKHGFWYRFNREVYEGKDYIACIVTHVGGHEEKSRFPAPADTGPGRSAIQAVASGESYARRYSLTAAFAITCADPDDDAAAQGQPPSGGAFVPQNGCISEHQVANLAAIISEAPDPDEEAKKFLAHVKVARLAEIRADVYDRAMKLLETRRAAGWGVKP